MDMAGEMVTDLAAYLGVQDLTSTADFPAAMLEFKAVLEKVGEGGKGLGLKSRLGGEGGLEGQGSAACTFSQRVNISVPSARMSYHLDVK